MIRPEVTMGDIPSSMRVPKRIKPNIKQHTKGTQAARILGEQNH